MHQEDEGKELKQEPLFQPARLAPAALSTFLACSLQTLLAKAWRRHLPNAAWSAWPPSKLSKAACTKLL